MTNLKQEYYEIWDAIKYKKVNEIYNMTKNIIEILDQHIDDKLFFHKDLVKIENIFTKMKIKNYFYMSGDAKHITKLISPKFDSLFKEENMHNKLIENREKQINAKALFSCGTQKSKQLEKYLNEEGANKMNIRIEWDGGYSLEDLENGKLDTNKDYGLYQVYGYHPVYGNNVLLYIGKADRQTFKTRLSQEIWWWNNEDSKNLNIYVGRIFDEKQPSDEEWSQMIDYAERMLIFAHSPAMNSSNIFTISRDKNILKEFENIRIFNYDNHKSLLPEISGEMWVKGYDFEYNGVFEYKE